ncbi:MAG TPA: hypothetical protein P5105_06285 [Victivallales bacterium]|nr:hypothetical protein [Victivallales bacterium]
MSENVNKRILDNIKNSQYSDSIKEFLTKIFLIELEASEKYKSNYAKRYDIEIRKYADSYNLENGLSEESEVSGC